MRGHRQQTDLENGSALMRSARPTSIKAVHRAVACLVFRNAEPDLRGRESAYAFQCIPKATNLLLFAQFKNLIGE